MDVEAVYWQTADSVTRLTNLPKSQSLRTPDSGSSSKFCGFMSRWQTPCECKYARLLNTWYMYSYRQTDHTHINTLCFSTPHTQLKTQTNYTIHTNLGGLLHPQPPVLIQAKSGMRQQTMVVTHTPISSESVYCIALWEQKIVMERLSEFRFDFDSINWNRINFIWNNQKFRLLRSTRQSC